MTPMPPTDELAVLQQALAEALRQKDALAGELRVTRTERDLLKEQLNQFKRQLFAAKSEASSLHQKDMFFNEAETEGAKAQPTVEESQAEAVEVPAHKRSKRGR